MVSISDYKEEEVAVCLSVLLELMTILGEFRENAVIVGGNVPPLLLPEVRHEYPGTLDIDLALDLNRIDDNTYKTLKKTLLYRDYYQEEGGQPFQYFRDVDGVTIKLDLMAGEYGGTGKSRRHQKIQDVKARKARGCDLAFEYFSEVELSGKLPSGAENRVKVKFANIIPFLVTKGMALWERAKEKDAYDIYFCIKHFPGGIKELVKSIAPITSNALVQEGLGKIKSKFESVNSLGPNYVADFLEISESEERDIIKREAFELVTELMEQLEISPYRE
jgi:hypothetical protein